MREWEGRENGGRERRRVRELEGEKMGGERGREGERGGGREWGRERRERGERENGGQGESKKIFFTRRCSGKVDIFLTHLVY